MPASMDMNTKQYPWDGEILPAPPTSAPTMCMNFIGEFKRTLQNAGCDQSAVRRFVGTIP